MVPLILGNYHRALPRTQGFGVQGLGFEGLGRLAGGSAVWASSPGFCQRFDTLWWISSIVWYSVFIMENLENWNL